MNLRLLKNSALIMMFSFSLYACGVGGDLDSRGGVHFLMEVDMKAGIDKALKPYSEEFRSFLRDKKLPYLSMKHVSDYLLVVFKDASERDEARAALELEYHNDIEFSDEALNKGFGLRATPTPLKIKNFKELILKQNIITLHRKFNDTGRIEPIIQAQGLEHIVVQFPGVQDPSVAREKLIGTATLEFRMVDEGNDPYKAQSSGNIPAGSKLFMERNGNPILLKSKVILSGDSITKAVAGFDANEQPSLNIILDEKGAERFSHVSSKNIKKLIAVVYIQHRYITGKLDDGMSKKRISKKEVINVARIQETLGKRFQITGLDSVQEAHSLAENLRAGTLAAPIYIVEERIMGASADTDKQY